MLGLLHSHIQINGTKRAWEAGGRLHQNTHFEGLVMKQNEIKHGRPNRMDFSSFFLSFFFQ